MDLAVGFNSVGTGSRVLANAADASARMFLLTHSALANVEGDGPIDSHAYLAPIQRAAYEGHADLVSFLLAHASIPAREHASLSLLAPCRLTPMHLACMT